MKEFDITCTYTIGDRVLHDYKVFEYQPDEEWYPEFSIAYIPSSWGWGVNGWKALNTWSMVKPSQMKANKLNKTKKWYQKLADYIKMYINILINYEKIQSKYS